MRLQNSPPAGAGKSQGTTKTERLLQIIEELGQDKVSFLPLGIRTAELAKAADINPNSIGVLLAPYITSGRIRCCKVTVPGRAPQNEYRKGIGVAAPDFKPLRTKRGPGSTIVARPGAATPAVSLSTPRQTIADIVTPTLKNTPQPEVGKAAQTPAAGGELTTPAAAPAVAAAPATPKPKAGAALKEEPATPRTSAGDDLRVGINADGVMVIALDDDSIELNIDQVLRLGDFLHATQGVCGHERQRVGDRRCAASSRSVQRAKRTRSTVGLGLAKSEDRNMTQEMTGWFSGLVRPTRKGVYQTKANDIPGYLWFNYWNGRRWSSGGYARVEDAHKFRHERQNDDVDYWRGLARPNDQVVRQVRTNAGLAGTEDSR